MNDALRDFINKFVIIYLNDIIIYFNFYKKYIKYLALVLQTLEKYKLYTKSLKYIIEVLELKFYSYVVEDKQCRSTFTKI